MKSKFFTQLIKQIIFVAVLFVGTAVNGQTKLVDFSGYNSATSTFPINQGASNYNTTFVSGAQLNYGGTGMLTDNDSRSWWNYTNNSATLDVNTAPYVEYVVNFSNITSIDFDRFVISGGANAGSSLTKFELRWSVDNYASNLGLFTLPTSSYTLSSVNLNSLSNFSGNQVKFRVYIYNTNGCNIRAGSKSLDRYRRISRNRHDWHFKTCCKT